MAATRTIAILGFGKEGRSLLSFLKRDPAYKGAKFWVLDRDASAKVPRGVPTMLGPHYLDRLTDFDIVFRSPGVPYNLSELKAARRKGTGFSSATKLFFERSPARIIGVTGSKGKTTTATLIHKMLNAGGKRAFLGGNVGTPPLDLIRRLTRTSWIVLELSSFQLQDLAASPRVAVLLELFPEHLDMKGGHGGHANVAEYYAAKAAIARHQKRGDAVFFLAHNPLTKKLAALGRGKKIPVSEKGFSLFTERELNLKGLHMFRNAIAAAAVARRLGVPARIVKKVATGFRGIEHRLEFVRRMGRVDFYNDSIATSPQAAAAAVRAFPDRRVILIAGGYDKKLNYAPLARALKGSTARLVVLLGQNRKKIAKAVARAGVPVRFAKDLRAAVDAAYRSAKRLPNAEGRQSGVAILLSPGAASFDMFKNYIDRGKRFKRIVKAL